jgi:23S rRNA (adenine2503-C2)-methyltransferase
MEPQNLVGMRQEEIAVLLAGMGEPPYRARQLYSSIYRRQVLDWERMTDLSRSFRAAAARRFHLSLPHLREVLTAADGTEKFLLGLEDGCAVEMVYIPEPKRDTLCISSQVGCNAACRFCVTGTLGLKRNLAAGEIIGQVLLCAIRKAGVLKRLNLVFMGMGEPLLNYEAVMKAVQLLTDPQGMALSPRRITLSTCGIVPGLERMAKESVIPLLAVSLGSADDAVRSELIPVNRKWNLERLLDACRAVPLRKWITFEYTLLQGVNDRPEDALALARLLRRFPAKVNLIPLNPHPAIPYAPSDPESVARFQDILFSQDISAFLRRSRGEDIQAACGQLVAGQA